MPEATAIADGSIFPIMCKPGIKRDGTTLDGSYYSDGQWCRFRLGRPKKMGGYSEIVNGLDGPIRGTHIYPQHPNQIIFSFSGNGVQCIPVDDSGVPGVVYSKTIPAFVTGDVYAFQSDVLYDTGGSVPRLIVHPGQTLNTIDQDTATTVYYGNPTDATAFVSTGQSVSGGCVVLGQYLFLYGSNGLIMNGASNSVTDYATGNANTVYTGGTKVVKGLPIRGGGQAPAGLFWSLDGLIRVTFVGGTAKWNYDIITKRSTILSSSGVIDYDGVFFWAGVDRFLMYNGVVKEVPNTLNQDFFFDNLNTMYSQKVWATSIPRWGEIWWFFPKGTSTECNHAVVYNVRENSWYDTPISRGTGVPARILTFPTWADAVPNTRLGTTGYAIYKHETGVNSIVGGQALPLDSFFETSQIGFASGGIDGSGTQNPNTQTRLGRIEPDFTQVGAMTVQVNGSAQAQAAVVDGTALSFDPDTGYVDVQAADRQKRMMTLKFRSNVIDGNYHMGKVLLHLEVGDQRS